jgi:hypothetical protein
MSDLELIDLGDATLVTREVGPKVRIDNLAGDEGYF